MTDERLICSVLKAALKSRRKKEKKRQPRKVVRLGSPRSHFFAPIP